MKKIAQFTLNVPNKLNNFGLTNDGYYFITTPSRIIDFDAQAPAGTRIKLNNIFAQNDSDYIIVGSNGLFSLDLSNYYTQITKIYFDFNFNTQEEPVIVDVIYEYTENKLPTGSTEEDNDQASGSLMEYFNQVEVRLTEKIDKFEGKIGASNNNIKNNSDSINQLQQDQTALEAQLSTTKSSLDALNTRATDIENKFDGMFEGQGGINTNYNNRLNSLESKDNELLTISQGLIGRIETIENTNIIEKYHNYGFDEEFIFIDNLPEGIHVFEESAKNKLKIMVEEVPTEALPDDCALTGPITLEVYTDSQIKYLTLLDENNNRWTGIKKLNEDSLNWRQFQYADTARKTYKCYTCNNDQINTINLEDLPEGVHIFCEDGRKRLSKTTKSVGDNYYNLPSSLLTPLEKLQNGEDGHGFPSILVIEIFRQYVGAAGFNIYKLETWDKIWMGYSQYGHSPLYWYKIAGTRD